MASNKQVLSALEQYRRSRHQFVQNIADLAQRTQHVESLLVCLPHLVPILAGPENGESSLAAVAIARMSHSASISEKICAVPGLRAALAFCLMKNNSQSTRAVSQAIKQLAKNSSKSVSILLENTSNLKYDSNDYKHGIQSKDLLELLAESLRNSWEPAVKEAVILAAAALTCHSANIAERAASLGILKEAVQILREERESGVRSAAATCISQMTACTASLARLAVDAGSVCALVNLVESHDIKLKKTALAALASIAQHEIELAESVLEAEPILHLLLSLLSDPDCHLRRNAMNLVRQLVRHGASLAQLMVSLGFLGAAAAYMDLNTGIVEAMLTVGFICSHSEQLAASVLASQMWPKMSILMVNKDFKSKEEEMSALLWTIGQAGQHSAQHSRIVCLSPDLLRNMISISLQQQNNQLSDQALRTLSLVIQNCTAMDALEPLFLEFDLPDSICISFMTQFAKILPNDASSRKSFVASGCLKKMQNIMSKNRDLYQELCGQIALCFPPEIVKFYSPDYPEALLQRLDTFSPEPQASN
ncbi:MAG: Sperm-associated antigen 6 [Paramarteilia canceri]